jgi:Methylase involved in ubiquinone/menaquinone biosynthesis
MSSGKSEKMQIPTNWTFRSPEVAADFDRHVREQLPWYDLATGAVAHFVRHYLPEGGLLIDVGASTGNIGRAVADILKARSAELIAIDNSEEMVAAYDGPGRAVVGDVREFDFADYRPDVIVSFLVLMFLPAPDRRSVIERMKGSIRPGGAVIVFDKMEPGQGYLSSVVYRLTLAGKYEAGAAPDEIIKKELSLAGVQRPMTEGELTDFRPIFRFGDFAGFVYERPI